MTYYAPENLLCSGCRHFREVEEVDNSLCVTCGVHLYPQFFAPQDEEEPCEYFEPAEVGE